MPEDEKSPLETLRHRLYAAEPISAQSQSSMRQRGAGAFSGWNQPVAPGSPHARIPLSTKFFIGALAFFLIAGLAAVGMLIFGARAISTTRVDVQVAGPTTIASGDTVALVVTVRNDNPVAITDAELTVDLPTGARYPDDPTKDFEHYADTLGTLDSGESVSRTVRAVVFGSEGQALTIPVQVTYRTENSNANPVKEAAYTLTVTTSPISLNVSSVSEVASGQPLSVSVNVRSNAATQLDNVAVAAEYPPGFTFTSANPAPTSGSVFMLGTFRPGETKTITVSGSLTGQEADQRAFRFTAGTTKDENSPSIAIPYTSNQSVVSISKPFLGISLAMNHQSSDTLVILPGTPVSGLLSWANSLSTPVTDAQVTVKFAGNAFESKSVTTQNGFYNSSTNTLSFTKDTTPGLATLQPGDKGTGTFTFVPKAGVQSPTITMAITVSGKRAGGGGTIAATINRTVLVGTKATLTSQALRTQSPFTNSGPFPPKAEQETTYTIQLSASSSLNPVGGATVTAKLPSYVRYTGQVSPGDASVSFDETTRTVTWKVGDLTTGVPKTAAFQVAALPSATQKGTSPVLVGEQSLAGTDKFTKASVTATASALLTGTVQ